MGNLEKAGIGVVVVLLLVIMVVAFMGDSGNEDRQPLDGRSRADLDIGPAPDPDGPGSGGERIAGGSDRDDGGVVIIPRPRRSDPPVRPEPGDPMIDPPPPDPGDGPPVDPPVPAPVLKEVVVKKDQSLWIIARDEYGAGNADRMVPLIAQENSLANAARISEGQILRLPPMPGKTAVASDASSGAPPKPAPKPRPARTVPMLPFVPNPVWVSIGDEETSSDAIYVVKQGDTLGTIAQKTLGSARRAKEIADLNGVANMDAISEGQRLRIPGR